MKEDPSQPEKISVNVEQDLRKHMRKISQRLNANPEIARRLLVNPILAFQEVGIELSAEVKQHIVDALRFPPGLERRKQQLEANLREEFARIGFDASLPLKAEQRAELLFGVLKLPPLGLETARSSALAANRTRAYARHHPLVAKLAEYERLRQGGLVFQPRDVYEAHKSGKRRQHWIKTVRFKV